MTASTSLWMLACVADAAVLRVAVLCTTGGSTYSGPFACAADIYRTHGAKGFLRGWTANYARLGPQTVVAFLTAEKLRVWVGLKSL
jgi:Mitochondrial carrier protein